MNEDRSTTRAESIGGKVKEDFRRIAREAQAQIRQDLADEAQEIYGQIKDAPVRFAGIVQRTVEQQPYIAVAIALAVGWLLGRTHRPF